MPLISDNIVRIGIGSDFHINRLDPQYQLENIEEYFFKILDKIKPHIIMLAGDLWDHKISMDNPAAGVSNRILTTLKTRYPGAIIIIIHGTREHDYMQLNMFSQMCDERFRIYNTVTIDHIDEMRFLMIPEEYMTDPVEYYKDYIMTKKKYDFILGHGMLSHIGFVSSKIPKFRRLTSPIWDYEKNFKNIVHGLVLFGHYHMRNVHKKFRYISSIGRYQHGEEEPKGFISLEYDRTKKKVIKEKFHVNKGALIFKTIKESTLPKDEETLMIILKAAAKKAHKLRIQFDKECTEIRRNVIYSFVKNHLNTSIDDRYRRKNRKKNEVFQTTEEVLINKYDGMDIYDATVEFIASELNVNITREEIIKLRNSV